MSDQSKTCYPPNSEDLHNAIFSPASQSGATPCAKPDGPMTEKSGPAVARANLSARQAKELGLLTSGTYGPRFITSSGSVRLEKSLVSKLQAKTASLGSALFRLTWKQRDTPLGVSIYALRASARRTSDKDCTSWLTPNTPSGGPNVKPSAKHTGGMDLEGAATLAPWSTPRANKWGFPDAHGSDERPMAGWPTTTRDWKDGSECPNVPLNSLLGRVAWLTDSGKTLSGSSAETKSSGQLNPGLPRWLQGLPTAWESCADMVTPLRRQSRKVSSKPI